MTEREEALAIANKMDAFCSYDYEDGTRREWYEFSADEVAEFWRLAKAAGAAEQKERDAQLCEADYRNDCSPAELADVIRAQKATP